MVIILSSITFVSEHTWKRTVLQTAQYIQSLMWFSSPCPHKILLKICSWHLISILSILFFIHNTALPNLYICITYCAAVRMGLHLEMLSSFKVRVLDCHYYRMKIKIFSPEWPINLMHYFAKTPANQVVRYPVLPTISETGLQDEDAAFICYRVYKSWIPFAKMNQGRSVLLPVTLTLL